MGLYFYNFLPVYDNINRSYGFKHVFSPYSFTLPASVINANSCFKVTFLARVYKHNFCDDNLHPLQY